VCRIVTNKLIHDLTYTVIFTPLTSLVQIQISVALTNTKGFVTDKNVSYELCIHEKNICPGRELQVSKACR